MAKMELEQHIKNLKEYIEQDEILEQDNSDFAQFCKSHCEDIQAVLDELDRIRKFDIYKLVEDVEDNEIIFKSQLKEELINIFIERDKIYDKFLKTDKLNEELHAKGLILEGKIQAYQNLIKE